MRWPLLLIFSVLALGVASPAVAPAQTRVEETALATIVYTGGWFQSHSERPWSGGTAALSNAALSRATLTFSGTGVSWRSEEHTSELQSQSNLVCRLLLEKKKKRI